MSRRGRGNLEERKVLMWGGRKFRGGGTEEVSVGSVEIRIDF